MTDNKIRLQKHLASCGVASRRACEELIQKRLVRVNGRIASIGDKIDPKRDKIEVRGKSVVPVLTKRYIMLYKPRGYVTTASDEYGRKTVLDLVQDVGVRLFPVGRLDKDSEGLIFLTNDGDFANQLTHPSHNVNKTYRVTVEGEVDDEKIDKLCSGVNIEGRTTKPCDVYVIDRRVDSTVLIFTIHEGINRQIRKMCEVVDLKVIRLKRTEIAGVKMGMLKVGKWRDLNEREMKHIKGISQSGGDEL